MSATSDLLRVDASDIGDVDEYRLTVVVANPYHRSRMGDGVVTWKIGQGRCTWLADPLPPLSHLNN